MSKKESYWFSHDSNAAGSPQMVALIRKYGFEGYGRWWRLLERLRESENYRYNIGTPFAWDVLGQDMMMSAGEAEAFVRDCVEYFQLLQSDGQFFWCNNLNERMEYWEKRRETLRERGRKGGLAARKNSGGTAGDNDEQEESTSEAQVNLSLTLHSAEVNNSLCTNDDKQANETKQNETKRNKTTLLKEKDNEDENKAAGTEQNETFQNFLTQEDGTQTPVRKMETTNIWEVLKNKALADSQRFVYPYVSAGRVNAEQLGHWLTAFNRWLEFTGEQIKEERDYRRHFAAWFKYRDPRHEDPRQYNPALRKEETTAGNTMPLAKATPPPAPGKTVPLPVLLPPEQPTGKYSKRDNKYDMHWLKNLRDEVRSIGG